MRSLSVAAIMMLAGCSPSAGDKAAREYEIAASAGITKQEQCRLSQKVAAGYLADENRSAYTDWSLQADLNCMEARYR